MPPLHWPPPPFAPTFPHHTPPGTLPAFQAPALLNTMPAPHPPHLHPPPPLQGPPLLQPGPSSPIPPLHAPDPPISSPPRLFPPPLTPPHPQHAPPPTLDPPAQPAVADPNACSICHAPTPHDPAQSWFPICAHCRRANNLCVTAPGPTPPPNPHPPPDTTHAPTTSSAAPAHPASTPTLPPPSDLSPPNLATPPGGGVPSPFHFAHAGTTAGDAAPSPLGPPPPLPPQQTLPQQPATQPTPSHATAPDPLAALRAQLLAQFPDRPPLPPTRDLPLLSHLDPSATADGMPLASHPKLYTIPVPLNLSSSVAFPRLRKLQDGGASAARYAALAQGPHNGWGMSLQELATPSGPVSPLTQALARTLLACSRAPHLTDALCPICLTRHLPLPCPIAPNDTAAAIERARAFCSSHYGTQSACVTCGVFHAPHPCPPAAPR